ncbi:hypothetical protein LCGC14_3109530, partial [marine sediment metagenome]
DKLKAELAAARGGYTQYVEMRMKSRRESLDNSIRFCTWVVKSGAMRDLAWYQRPVWQQLPGRHVSGSGGHANEHAMFPWSVGKTVAIGPYPIRKALTPAEYRQMRGDRK